VDALIAKAATSLASSLAVVLGKTVGRRIADGVLGSPEQRQLDAACAAAVGRVVENMTKAGSEDPETAHALTLVERLVQARRPDGLPVLQVEPDEVWTALQEWRSSADDIGFDLATFPLGFDAVIEGLLTAIPDECTRAARRSGSPLFNQVVISNLERLRAEVLALSPQVGDGRLARLTPIAAAVRASLDDARLNCEMTDRKFYTPDLLLGLLQTPESRVIRCFNMALPGLGEDVRQQLQHYVSALNRESAGPYIPFDWMEREEVRHAQMLAWEAGAGAVTEVHLLLGFLETESNTREQLASMVDLERLRDCAMTLQQASPGPGTPGAVLGGRCGQ
jgi:hypothetical protein